MTLMMFKRLKVKVGQFFKVFMLYYVYCVSGPFLLVESTSHSDTILTCRVYQPYDSSVFEVIGLQPSKG